MSSRTRTRVTRRRRAAYLEYLEARCLLSGAAPTITDLSIHRDGGGACEIAPNGHAVTAGSAGRAGA